MRLPGAGGLDNFIVTETSENGDYREIVPTTDGDDVNTAFFEPFREETSYATRNLKGCTAMAIISRKGIYVAHYWESISFIFETDDDAGRKKQENTFRKTVLKGLDRGVIGQQHSLRNAARELEDDYIHAYLIHPSTHAHEDESDKELGYRSDWDKIRAAVIQYLPKVGSLNRWIEIPYDVEENWDVLNSTPRGRLLFKFDPRHQTADGRVVNKAILWSEAREIHNDEW